MRTVGLTKQLKLYFVKVNPFDERLLKGLPKSISHSNWGRTNGLTLWKWCFFRYFKCNENTVLKKLNSKKIRKAHQDQQKYHREPENSNLVQQDRFKVWKYVELTKRTPFDELFSISKVSRDTDRQNTLHFLPAFYSSRNQQLLRGKPMFKSTLKAFMQEWMLSLEI